MSSSDQSNSNQAGQDGNAQNDEVDTPNEASESVQKTTSTAISSVIDQASKPHDTSPNDEIPKAQKKDTIEQLTPLDTTRGSSLFLTPFNYDDYEHPKAPTDKDLSRQDQSQTAHTEDKSSAG